MATTTGIVNRALDELGAEPIVNLTDGSTNANTANRQFPELRDSLLRSNVWNFAITHVRLARLATAPIAGFDFQYQLPPDYIRMAKVSDNDDHVGTLEYRLEGEKTLHTNANEVYIRYVRRVEDPNKMTSDFREALSMKCAAAWAVKVTNSLAVKEGIEILAKSTRQRAASTDTIEDFPERLPEGSWVTERGR